MAFEIANAVQTPFPFPDMSSPSNNLLNLSFIISISTQRLITKYKKQYMGILKKAEKKANGIKKVIKLETLFQHINLVGIYNDSIVFQIQIIYKKTQS